MGRPGHMNEKTIKIMSAVLWGIMLANSVLALALYGQDSFSKIVLGDTAVLCLILVLNYKKGAIDFKALKKRYIIPLLVIGLSFLLWGAVYGVIGYIAIGLTFTVIVPAANLVFSSRGETVYWFMATGTVWTFIAYTVFSVLCGPAIDKNQYAALMGNPNGLGAFMAVTVPAAIYLIIYNRANGKKTAAMLMMLALAFAVSIGYFTNSRTSLLMIIGQLVFVGITCAIRQFKENRRGAVKVIAKDVIVLALCFLIAFPGTFFGLTTVKEEIAEAFPSIQIKVDMERDEDLSLKDRVKISSLRFTKGLNGTGEFSSGRIVIWGAYISEIDFGGHPKESMDIETETRIYDSTNAHNFYLQVAYSAGLAAGLALLILTAVMVLELIKAFFGFLRNKEYRTDMIIFTCYAIAFVLISITSGGYMLYTYLVPTFMWLMGYPLFVRRRETDEICHNR